MILEARACPTFQAHIRTTRSTRDYAEALGAAANEISGKKEPQAAGVIP
jgi:hypothetical protein